MMSLSSPIYEAVKDQSHRVMEEACFPESGYGADANADDGGDNDDSR